MLQQARPQNVLVTPKTKISPMAHRPPGGSRSPEWQNIRAILFNGPTRVEYASDYLMDLRQYSVFGQAHGDGG
jgi:hypothetical protein